MEALNRAIVSGSYDELAGLFAPEAVMSFVGVPVGPFRGRVEILAAYEQNPPDDTMEVVSVTSDGPSDVAGFRWSRGGSGTMTMRWEGELLAELSVAFDTD